MGSSHVQGALWGVESRLWSATFEPITRPLFEQVHDELGTGGGGFEGLGEVGGMKVARRLAGRKKDAWAGGRIALRHILSAQS